MLDTNKVMTWQVGIYCDGEYVMSVGNNGGVVRATYNQVAVILDLLKPMVKDVLYPGHYLACDIMHVN